MKEKYQNWIKAIRNVAKPVYKDGTMSIIVAEKIANEAADFLQSLADMQEQEPDDYCTFARHQVNINMGCATDWVTKANRDWWMAQYFAYSIAKDNLVEELAAANARIAELNNVIEYWKSLVPESNKDQPKRPLLADQCMTHDQLDCILNLIRVAVDEPINFKLWNECVVTATKLLVKE